MPKLEHHIVSFCEFWDFIWDYVHGLSTFDFQLSNEVVFYDKCLQRQVCIVVREQRFAKTFLTNFC